MLSLSRSVADLATVLAASGSGGGGGGIFSILFLLLIPVAMYFLLIRPQSRRRKEQAAQQASVSVGDEVMTTAGVYGFITGFDGDIVWLEIDDNVQIRIARAAIQRKGDTSVDTSTPEALAHKPDDTGTRSTPIADSADDATDQ